MTPSDITGGAGIGPKKRLADEFTKFRRAMRLDEQPSTVALAMQGAYICGAQACFRILQKASELTQEEAVILWGELQSEILNAMPKQEEKQLVVPARTM